MNESEIFVCKQCGREHEALTQEIASYLCPMRPKSKGNLKMLDQVSLKRLTEIDSSSETQDLQKIKERNGDNYESS